MVQLEKFEGEEDWIKASRNKRNGEKGDKNLELQLESSAKKAILDPDIKGRDDALAKIKSMGMAFKSETMIEPVYKESTFDKNIKKVKKLTIPIKMPEQNDIMFQPDPTLLTPDEK